LPPALCARARSIRARQGHYPRGPLHVPDAQQGADTPTHTAGTGMGRARAMAISHPHTSLALKYEPCAHGAPPVFRHVDRPLCPDPQYIEQTRIPRRALSVSSCAPLRAATQTIRAASPVWSTVGCGAPARAGTCRAPPWCHAQVSPLRAVAAATRRSVRPGACQCGVVVSRQASRAITQAPAAPNRETVLPRRASPRAPRVGAARPVRMA